jgi:hypothetical protein
MIRNPKFEALNPLPREILFSLISQGLGFRY